MQLHEQGQQGNATSQSAFGVPPKVCKWLVGGVGEEGVALVRAGPLRSGIGRRDELRRHLAGCSESGVIERRQILSNRPARIGSKLVDVPRFAWRRALLIGVRRNQAGVDGEPFAAYQTFA